MLGTTGGTRKFRKSSGAVSPLLLGHPDGSVVSGGRIVEIMCFFPPFYREHRKRLQQSKVGSVLLSLVEISKNTFGVDVMMCGPYKLDII